MTDLASRQVLIGEPLYDLIEEVAAQLYKRSLTDLPPDVRRAVDTAFAGEDGRQAKMMLRIIQHAVDTSDRTELIVCQDTGIPVFFVGIGTELTAAMRAQTICVLVTKQPGGGTIQLRWNGATVATTSLNAPSTQKQVLVCFTLGSVQTGTQGLVSLGAGTGATPYWTPSFSSVANALKSPIVMAAFF